MEAVRAGKVAMQETGGTSQGNNDSISIEIADQEADISIAKMLESFDDALKDEKAGDQQQTNISLIPRVPAHLRANENLNKYFAPKFVSVGPYHHESSALKVTEQIKIKLAAMFIKDHLRVGTENLYLKIKGRIEDLRKYYEADATEKYDDHELARMFLIDGCVVLYFIYSGIDPLFPNSERKSKMLEILNLKVLEIVGFSGDLLLLENQLPYKVIKLLISSSEAREMLEIKIQQFICRKSHIKLEQNQKLLSSQGNPPHLLSFMRTIFINSVRTDKNNFIVEILDKSMKCVGMLFHIPKYLIALLLDILPHHETVNLLTIDKIGNLKQAGIKLKPNNTGCWKDISFSHGTLKLPIIFVNNVTVNLIAYEMCPHFGNNFEVSAYIYFLAKLVSGTQDVRELQHNNILYDLLDNDVDEEIVKLFKEMGNETYMFDTLRSNVTYIDISKKIHQHCSKKYNVWMAQLYNRYFESPWSVIALVGVVIALSATVLQTVYTVLGYYHHVQ